MSELTYKSALVGIAIQIFDVVWENGEGVLGKLKALYRKQRAKRRINAALLKYEKRFKKRYGGVKIIGKNEDVDVNLVFTDVEYIAHEVNFQENDSLQTLAMQFLDERRFSKNQKAKRKSVFDIAKKTDHLMLLGGPGAGKTTFLKKVGMEAFKHPKYSKYGYRCIPVFISLKRLISKHTSIEQLIQEEFETAEMPDALEFTREALRMGKLLVLLDGLDEIPYVNLSNALSKIREFIDKYDANRYIASCREGANYHRLLESFTSVQIADFSDRQIDNFVKVWFQLELTTQSNPQEKVLCAERQKKFLKTLQKDKYSALRELASNPLLLSLLCLVYQGSNNLPSNRVSLFQQSLELFINKWFALKHVQPNPILDQEFDPILEKAMLSEIAYRGFIHGKVFFSEKELKGYIKAYIDDNLNASNLDATEVLDTIKIYQGILIDQIHGHCSFSHVAFQEYLTAQYIYDNNQVACLVEKHLGDKRWKEVFPMVSGLLISGSDDLLQKMEQGSRKFVRGNKVTRLVSWTESMVSSKTYSFQSRVYICADRIRGKHLECSGWDLVIRHVATFYILGSLLWSYARALDGEKQTTVEFLSSRIELSNILIRYSSAIISNVYEYLSSKAIYEEESKEFFKLINSIRSVGTTAKSMIALEGSEQQLEKFKTLRGQLKDAEIFQNVNFGPIRENIQILRQRERSRQLKSADSIGSPIEKMWQNWLQGLGLVPYDILTMSKNEVIYLENYLHTNLLLVNCRIRAVKVSHDAWNHIVLRMMQRSAREQLKNKYPDEYSP